MNIKKALSGKDFLEQAKPFAANMTSNKKTLHRTGCKQCYYSQFMSEYVDFDTLEEAENFSPRLTKCQNCFPVQ